jgi:hypothetical protein
MRTVQAERRLCANPSIPSRPLANSQAAAGSGVTMVQLPALITLIVAAVSQDAPFGSRQYAVLSFAPELLIVCIKMSLSNG